MMVNPDPRKRRMAQVAGVILFSTALGGALLFERGGPKDRPVPLAGSGSSSASRPGDVPSFLGARRTRWSDLYARLPLSFEANRGQTNSQVRFLSRGEGYALFLTSREAVLMLRKKNAPVTAPSRVSEQEEATAVLRLQLAGANTSPQVEGLDELPGKSNYFIGRDPAKWRTGVPNYARVRYRRVYPGIDLVYYGNQRQLEYDFVVGPKADAQAIDLVIRGGERARVNSEGDLVLEAAGGQVVLRAPVVYQQDGPARRYVRGSYVLGPSRAAGWHVGFQVAAYDRTQPLVIDPSLSYSSYLGGSQNDSGNGLAVDSSGNAYLTGQTFSSDFPRLNPEQSTCGSCTLSVPGSNAFVTKVNSSGSALIYSTFLGGTSQDQGNAIAVDTSGNAYVAGTTSSTDFPVANAFQAAPGGGTSDAFVTKFNSSGSTLVFSTYLGGSLEDDGDGIAVDSGGNTYVVGRTASTNFPVVKAYQSTYQGGAFDVYVSKLDATGNTLLYSTYLGGSAEDDGTAIAVDSSGDAYVTGRTFSNNFPIESALQSAFRGTADAFVSKLNISGASITLAYSTYLGGSSTGDEGLGIALDSSKNVYVTGKTSATNFPTQNPFQSTFGGGSSDAFVSKLNSSGSTLVYSTYLGGNSADAGNAVAVDSTGVAHVVGSTSSSNFPTANPIQNAFSGTEDAFLTRLSPMGCGQAFSTYVGGSATNVGSGVAVDSSGDTYLVGTTGSNDFPVQNPFQAMTGGDNDAFLAKITSSSAPAVCLSETSLAFGAETATTTSQPMNSTLTNDGNAALTISSIVATGAFSETNTCGSSVSAGQNCTLSVTFSPVGAGGATGAVTITDNSAGASSATQTIALTGIGTDFALLASPQTDTVTAGQSATYTMTVTPSAQFNATVSLSCSGAPAPGTCSISPSSIAPTGSNSTATVTVTTVAPSLAPPPGFGNLRPPLGWLVVLLGLGLLAGGAWARRAGARRLWLHLVTGAGVALLVVAWFGCAISNPPPTSTPPGTYTITLTGTAGSLVHHISVGLTVQ